jgi:modulator of FtsH protease HflK
MNQNIEIDLSKYLRPDRILWGIAAIFVLWGGFTSFYTMPSDSEGVVLRFGKYNDTVPPGLHFKIPFGVDKVHPVRVLRQFKQEFGFATEEGATNPSQFSLDPDERIYERNMVTGDRNTAVVKWVVQYRVSDPKLFLFKVQNPEETLRNISEAVMRAMVGDRTVDEVITSGRQEIQVEARKELAAAVKDYKLGIRIDLVQLLNVKPPPLVEASFNAVNQAKQKKEEVRYLAEGKKEVIRLAKGEKDQKISTARGDATKRVNEAEGDVANFNAVFEEYRKAPEVTKQRIYLETMKDVLPKLGRKIILDQDASHILPLLQLETANPLGGRR